MKVKVEVGGLSKSQSQRERRVSVQKAHVSQMSNISSPLTDDASLGPGADHEACDAPVSQMLHFHDFKYMYVLTHHAQH
jgi:hypothetical protein